MSEAYQDAMAVTRQIREEVADQLHDLVVEREGLGSLDEVVNRVRRIGDVHRQVVQARARQRQAEEHGLARAPHVQAEGEALELLRSSVLSLGEACGSVVVGLDFEQRTGKVRIESGA